MKEPATGSGLANWLARVKHHRVPPWSAVSKQAARPNREAIGSKRSGTQAI